MAKQPGQRYASMAEMAVALDDFLQGKLTPAASAETGPETDARNLVAALLDEFRAWGWERGLRNVRGWLAGRVVEPEAADLLLRWLGGAEELEEKARQWLGGEHQQTLAAWVLAGRALA